MVGVASAKKQSAEGWRCREDQEVEHLGGAWLTFQATRSLLWVCVVSPMAHALARRLCLHRPWHIYLSYHKERSRALRGRAGDPKLLSAALCSNFGSSWQPISSSLGKKEAPYALPCVGGGCTLFCARASLVLSLVLSLEPNRHLHTPSRHGLPLLDVGMSRATWRRKYFVANRLPHLIPAPT